MMITYKNNKKCRKCYEVRIYYLTENAAASRELSLVSASKLRFMGSYPDALALRSANTALVYIPRGNIVLLPSRKHYKKTVLRENTTTIVFLFREDLAGIIAAIEGTIGDSLQHVLLLDVFRAFQVGYRTRNFQYTIIRTRREA